MTIFISKILETSYAIKIDEKYISKISNNNENDLLIQKCCTDYVVHMYKFFLIFYNK